MYKTCLVAFVGAVIIVTPVMAADLAALEKDVIARAESAPESAPDYFMSQIELRPAPATEVQAIYLYGMGIAYERMGDMVEAVDYYRGAELFGHKGAAGALVRLSRTPFPKAE